MIPLMLPFADLRTEPPRSRYTAEVDVIKPDVDSRLFHEVSSWPYPRAKPGGRSHAHAGGLVLVGAVETGRTACRH